MEAKIGLRELKDSASDLDGILRQMYSIWVDDTVRHTVAMSFITILLNFATPILSRRPIYELPKVQMILESVDLKESNASTIKRFIQVFYEGMSSLVLIYVFTAHASKLTAEVRCI